MNFQTGKFIFLTNHETVQNKGYESTRGGYPYPSLVGDYKQPFEDNQLVSQCGVQNGDHSRTGEAKHKSVDTCPWPVMRREEKVNKLSEGLKTIRAKMSTGEGSI